MSVGTITLGFALAEGFRRWHPGPVPGVGRNVVQVLLFGAVGFLFGVALAAGGVAVIRAVVVVGRWRAQRADRWRG